MALSFGESIRRNSPKASTFKLNALRSDAPALLSEEWEMDDNYLIYDEYSDENISEINDIKEIKMHPKQINLTQESNSQYIPFVASRYYDGFDFTTVTLSFHFTNKNGDEGYSAPINVAYNDKQIKFAWLVDNRVTDVEGRVDFEVMAVGLNSKGDDYTWRTKPCSLNVIKSLSGNGVFEPGAEWLNGFISKVAERAAGMIETVTGGNASIHVGSAETMPEGTKILIDPDGEAYEMLEVDDTLTRTGYAADAARVGTEINNIREDMMNFGGGSGTVKSVAGVEPDESGDVPLTPADIGAATQKQVDDLSEAIAGKRTSNVWYGTTSTAPEVYYKEVTTTTGDFKLVKGARVGVKFLHNTINCSALIVDGTDRKPIFGANYENGTTGGDGGILWHNGGQIQWFTYDGECFVIDDAVRATAKNNLVGKVAVSDSVNSTGDTVASSTAAKIAYDKAVEALEIASSGGGGGSTPDLRNVVEYPTGAKAGDLIAVASVDENGVPETSKAVTVKEIAEAAAKEVPDAEEDAAGLITLSAVRRIAEAETAKLDAALAEAIGSGVIE